LVSSVNVDTIFEENWKSLSLKITNILHKYDIIIENQIDKFIESEENYIQRMEYEKKLQIDIVKYNDEQRTFYRNNFKPYIDESRTIRRS
jgi:hypothetical protein